MNAVLLLWFLLITGTFLVEAQNFELEGFFEPKFFDVESYGAVSDGKTDCSQAFLRAWRDACLYPGRSRVWIPYGRFLVNKVVFHGPCRGTMSFIVKGTLLGPNNPSQFYADTWIGFLYVDNLTVKGGGRLDGRGYFAWPYNNCKRNPNCRALPPSLKLNFVRNAAIVNLKSFDSKSVHIDMFGCENVSVSHVRLSAPESSPNTDGIRIGNSNRVYISRSVISTGDDCIGILTGSRKIHVSGVVCGPGHGISIGSIGWSKRFEFVKGVRVANSRFVGTANGVRIKTWADAAYSRVSNVVFSDLVMEDVANPIIIDQQYCPNGSGCRLGRSLVQIRDVTFRNIYGMSASKSAVTLLCSESLPCRNVKLIDINLAYRGDGGGGMPIATCYNVQGMSYGRLLPRGCF